MYAGFWKRAIAFTIDVVIVYSVVVIVCIVLFLNGLLGLILNDNNITGFGRALLALFYLFNFFAPIFYWTLFECSSMQATPGKMLLGIKVTDMRGQKLDFLQSLGRNLGKIVSNVTLNIGYAMAGFTVRKQALHDKMAHCLVIDKNADINNLSALPKASLFIVVLAIFGVLSPLIIGIAVSVIALILMVVSIAAPLNNAKLAVNDLGEINNLQHEYYEEKGVYANDLNALISNCGDCGASLNVESFNYIFMQDGVGATYKKAPNFTIKTCYDTGRLCINKEVAALSSLKLSVVDSDKCCN